MNFSLMESLVQKVSCSKLEYYLKSFEVCLLLYIFHFKTLTDTDIFFKDKLIYEILLNKLFLIDIFITLINKIQNTFLITF